MWLLAAACFLLAGCGEDSLQSTGGDKETVGTPGQEEGLSKEQGEKEPQEIFIDLGIDSRESKAVIWEELIDRFNRQYPEYHVTMLYCPDDEDSNAYRAGIREKITAGKGPDILSNWYVDTYSYAEAGYIQPWGEVFTDKEKEEFLPGIMKEGEIKGELYAIPYGWSLDTLATSGERAGGREAWTWEELVVCTRAAGAEKVAETTTGRDLFVDGILSDKGNKRLIDWEKGTCDFSGDEVLEALEFAKEYGAETSAGYGMTYEGTWEGRTLTQNVHLTLERNASQGFNFCDALFGGDCVYIGYPNEQGRGHLISLRKLYLNGASKQKEGAAAFIRYLLSEEVQNELIREKKERYIVDYFSVRLSSVAYAVSLAKQEADKGEWAEPFKGFTYDCKPLTQEQEEKFYGMLEHSSFVGEDVLQLSRYTSDALDGFFHGEQTAEQTAKLLQQAVERYFADMDALELPVR